MTLVHATHNERHVGMSTLLWLQYMPPTAGDMYARSRYYISSTCDSQWVTCMQEHDTKSSIYVTPQVTHARAYHYVSSTCHPRWVTCMQEHDTQNPSRTIPWSILQRVCKTQAPPLVRPTDSRHYISSTCHSQRVSCMQEHSACATHKTHKTQASHLVILISSQDPSPDVAP